MSEQDEKLGHEDERDDVELHKHHHPQASADAPSEDEDSGDDFEAHKHHHPA